MEFSTGGELALKTYVNARSLRRAEKRVKHVGAIESDTNDGGMNVGFPSAPLSHSIFRISGDISLSMLFILTNQSFILSARQRGSRFFLLPTPPSLAKNAGIQPRRIFDRRGYPHRQTPGLKSFRSEIAGERSNLFAMKAQISLGWGLGEQYGFRA